MKCLRCGFCCKNLSVVIVADPSKPLKEDNLEFHEGGGKPCRHLRQNKRTGKYRCAVHNKRWYKKTPCFSHGQIEPSKDTPCRMGVFQLSNKEKPR